jgi:hypothetical protein
MKSCGIHLQLNVVSVRETTDGLLRGMPREKTQLTGEDKLNDKVSHFTYLYEHFSDYGTTNYVNTHEELWQEGTGGHFLKR